MKLALEEAARSHRSCMALCIPLRSEEADTLREQGRLQRKKKGGNRKLTIMANIIAVYPLVGGKAQEEILSPLHEQKVSQRRTDLYTAAMLGSS